MNRVDVLLSEYRDLRSEIVRLSSVQHLLLGLNLVLAIALAPIHNGLRDTGTVALVAIPFVFTIVAWLHVSQDMTIISTARYLHQRLRPAIVDALDDGEGRSSAVLGWESYQNEGRTADRLGPVMIYTWGMRCLASMGPTVGYTIWGAVNLGWDRFSGVERFMAVGLVVAQLLAVAGVGILTRWVAPGYRSIADID